MSGILLRSLFPKSFCNILKAHYVISQRPASSLNKIYVVIEGRQPGFYLSWEECEQQVLKHPKAQFKKFTNKKAAFLYFENAVNNIEKLYPNRRKSVQKLKNILGQYKEWKNEIKEFEPHCESSKSVDNKVVGSSLFSSMYSNISSCSEKECDSLEADRNHSWNLEENLSADDILEIAEASQNLDSKYDNTYIVNYESVISSTPEITEEESSILSDIFSTSSEKQKLITAKEICFLMNMSDNLEENGSDNKGIDLHSLEEAQETEFHKIYGSEFSVRLTNRDFENSKEKILDYNQFYDLNESQGKIDKSNFRSTPDSLGVSIPDDNEEMTTALHDLGRKLEKEVETTYECKSCEAISSNLGGTEHVVDGYLEIYTDGSCHNSGQDNSKGAVGVYFGPNSKLNTSLMLEGRVTNNIAEIRAALLGLKIARENGFTKVRLFTDSEYLVKSLTLWIKQWKRNNWRRANGKPVLNQEELKNLEIEISKLDDVKLVHVRGHKGIEGNVRADQLAQDCVSAYISSKDTV